MTLLAVERIKLFTTRSPWWCMLLAFGLAASFAFLISANTPDQFPLTITETQGGDMFGLIVMMVMAALAVTTEYRFGTIRASFQAVPNRISLLLAKTAVVAVVSGVVGEIIAFTSYGIARLVKPNQNLALGDGADWRIVAGVGLVYAVGAVIAVAVGILLRQSAGAITLLLVYVLLVENLIVLIPHIGPNIQKWMPFVEASNFAPVRMGGGEIGSLPFGPWGSLLYFAGIAAVLLGAALTVAKRRDA